MRYIKQYFTADYYRSSVAGNKHQKISSGAGNKIGFSSFSNKVESDCIPTVIIKMKSSVVFQCFFFVLFVTFMHTQRILSVKFL